MPSIKDIREFDKSNLNLTMLPSSKDLYLIVLNSSVSRVVPCWIEINTGKWSDIVESIKPHL